MSGQNFKLDEKKMRLLTTHSRCNSMSNSKSHHTNIAMRISKQIYLFASILLILIGACRDNRENKANSETPLALWNEGAAKTAIIDFVTKTTTIGSPDFIPLPDRIACFDNDGTLWCEQPLYSQMLFVADRIHELAPSHPEWKTVEPFKSVLAGEVKKALAGSNDAAFILIAAAQSGITADAFDSIANRWIHTAIHPKTKNTFIHTTYQPMIELLNYLRENSYKTYIVSGSGQDFMRQWTLEAYGISSEQVIGSSLKGRYEVVNDRGQIIKIPELNFLVDTESKPIAIYQQIGKRPVFTVGNSDGDYAMLQYTTSGKGPRFGMIIHHTDSIREYAYDRGSSIGKLEKGLDDAAQNKWVIVDMKNEWKEIFPSK